MLPPTPTEPLRWWQTRLFAAALIVAAVVPLLLPPLPPLTDVLGHMGRYHIELNIDRSPYLKQWYSFTWGIMGNLGVDLLIVPVAKIFGVELGTKLIVMAIPAMTVAGLLLIAREIHGRLPPTAAFVLPLAYGFPFNFGFVNFALSMALALLAFGVWLRLGRQGRWRLRAALFVPLSAMIWVAHSYGWGVLGLMAFASDAILQRGRGAGWWRSLFHAGIACLPLAPPVILTLIWREGAGGVTLDFLNWDVKTFWMAMILRERWAVFDIACAALLYAMVLAACVGFRLRIDRTMAATALILLLAFLSIPRILLGSAYADMRLAPFLVAIAVIGIAPKKRNPRLAAPIAMLALAFFAARIAGTTATYLKRDAVYRDQLQAIDHLPRGARVFVLVDLPCLSRWEMAATDHLGAIAIIRRDAFVNGQWEAPGAQLLRVTYDKAGWFGGDPSQVVRPRQCTRGTSMAQRIAQFPRDAFDYLWLIDRPAALLPREPGLTKVWAGARTGALYRIGSATSPIDTPTGSGATASR